MLAKIFRSSNKRTARFLDNKKNVGTCLLCLWFWIHSSTLSGTRKAQEVGSYRYILVHRHAYTYLYFVFNMIMIRCTIARSPDARPPRGGGGRFGLLSRQWRRVYRRKTENRNHWLAICWWWHSVISQQLRRRRVRRLAWAFSRWLCGSLVSSNYWRYFYRYWYDYYKCFSWRAASSWPFTCDVEIRFYTPFAPIP